MNVPTFICKCGREHACVLIQRGHAHDDVVILKNNWLLAVEKLHAKYGVQASKESIEAAEEVEHKACKAYLDTVVWQYWSLPDTVTTVKAHGGYMLKCANDCLEI